MKNNYTDISIILDRSGSMDSIKTDTIGGFNSFLKEQQSVGGECTISLYQFDDRYEMIYEGKKIKNAPSLNNETFVPRGWTALLDAIGRTINSTGARLSKMKESDRPSKVIIVIVTDGQENQSKEFTKNQIFDMITHQKNNYNWQFVFLGANQDAIKVAGDYGIAKSSTLTYATSSIGTQSAYRSFSSNLANYRVGTSCSVDFSENDRNIQEEELKKTTTK